LLIAAPQRPLPHQHVQQHGGAGGRVGGFAAWLRLGQGVLGGGGVKQVQYLPGVQAERAAGDEDQVGDLQRRGHGVSRRVKAGMPRSAVPGGGVACCPVERGELGARR
jgi:hypothetical protein